MKIVLRMDGKDKTFVADFVTARHYRDAILIHRKIEANPKIKDEELFELLFPLIVSVFGNQFTVDDILDGIRFDKINEENQRIFHTVLGLLKENDELAEGNESGEPVGSMPTHG